MHIEQGMDVERDSTLLQDKLGEMLFVNLLYGGKSGSKFGVVSGRCNTAQLIKILDPTIAYSGTDQL